MPLAHHVATRELSECNVTHTVDIAWHVGFTTKLAVNAHAHRDNFRDMRCQSNMSGNVMMGHTITNTYAC
jgi:hypothetical protein